MEEPDIKPVPVALGGAAASSPPATNKLDLRKTSEVSGLSRGDEQAVLSDGEVAIATSRAEKLVDRSSGGSEFAGILGKSSTVGKRILIIEDEHFITELYTRALTKAGYQVENVIDGIEGLKQAQTDRYDIILLDIMIPNLMGTEILHRLRDPKQTPKLHGKIILTTNLDQGDEGRAATEKYADGYIIKADITPKELVSYLAKIKV